MLDWEGNMVKSKDRTKFMMSDIEDDCEMTISCVVGDVKNNAIDQALESNLGSVEGFRGGQAQDHILVEVSSVLDPNVLCERLCHKEELSGLKMAIGATSTSNKEHILGDGDTLATEDETDLSLPLGEASTSDDDMLDLSSYADFTDWENRLAGKLDLDTFMA
eukprot:4267138-Ditylum_brightwellii.AAC.1